eukprot:scaffold6814_cov117-Isochrysis_galbana.AAC.6
MGDEETSIWRTRQPACLGGWRSPPSPASWVWPVCAGSSCAGPAQDGPSAIDGLNKEKGVEKEWEGRGGVTGRP